MRLQRWIMATVLLAVVFGCASVFAQQSGSADEMLLAVQNQDWVKLAVIVLGIVWSALGISERLTQWRQTQLQKVEVAGNELERQARLLIRQLTLDAEAAAQATYDIYVRNIKAASSDGKLTDEERSQAMKSALQKLASIGKEKGVDYFREYSEPLLRAMIEQAVTRLKRGGDGVPVTG
jgi:hypothetical protein